MSYQTILLVVQGLPRQWETVDRFSTIIGAPFRGEARCSSAIVDAFSEFWESAYADVNEPEGGWPVPIKAALRASRRGDEASSTSQNPSTVQTAEDDSRDDQSPRKEIPGGTPREILSTGGIELDQVPRITIANDSTQPHPRDTTTICKSPSTPRKERRIHVSTPPRRHKTFSSPKTMGSEPRSPLADLRKGNVSSTSFYTSPTPKASDKENVGPKPLPDIFASVLGKRKMESTIEDSTSYVKRRISSSRSVKTTRTSLVTGDTTIASESPTETAGDGVVNTPQKKRKSEVFAGVVLPTMKEVMLRRRHSAPLKEVADSQLSGDPAFSSTAVLEVVDHGDGDLEASPRKKKRIVRSGEQITLMEDFPVAGSGKYCSCLRLHNEFETDYINYCQNR